MSSQPASDAEAFYEFLGAHILSRSAAKSPEELLSDWRAQREYRETIGAVEEGIRDMEAGRMQLVRDLLANSAQS